MKAENMVKNQLTGLVAFVGAIHDDAAQTGGLGRRQGA